MDKECIELCDAINDIPFLITFDSCCGHEKHTFDIWLEAKNLAGLYILSRCIDRRYCGPVTEQQEGKLTKYIPWNLLVEDCDRTMKPIFHLTSNIKGPLAYKQAMKIAENIRYTLKHKNCMKLWQRANKKKQRKILVNVTQHNHEPTGNRLG